tara:strand:- start:993 stop:1496 length:504 start_codon:yes stop_codon:yes gene_type:complete
MEYLIGIVIVIVPVILFFYILDKLRIYQSKLEFKKKLLEEERISREKKLQEQKEKRVKKKQLRRKQKLEDLKNLLKQKSKENDGSKEYNKIEITPLKKKIKKIELEILHEKASKNPFVNLKDVESFRLHIERLNRYGHSVWRGECEYMGEKGGIYTLSANGNRRYKY